MNLRHNDTRKNKKGIIWYFYLITVFSLSLTGFGQMPIFKRYYIADIPGLGWLGKFYVTHYMHYLFAIMFIAFITYIITGYLFAKGKGIKITWSGYFRGGIIFGLVITGGLLVIRNLAGSGFEPGFIIFLDLSHLGLVIMLLLAGVYCAVFKKRWAKNKCLSVNRKKGDKA
ncbi:MAG: hypothetical protein L6247_02950 [Desulfobacteraceae bacterium]|nr:hypothetical protein [Pseudomonadota bacterium]MBU4462955.1 hypothetical protein [Pseudomonadota bacterium]MCG2754521.1 hypothetical protein [Desulfobacteraceae bacterium]